MLNQALMQIYQILKFNINIPVLTNLITLRADARNAIKLMNHPVLISLSD